MPQRSASLQSREPKRAGKVAELPYATRSLAVAALYDLADVAAYSHCLNGGLD